jgi:uncharacterized protein (TIGR03435 family)
MQNLKQELRFALLAAFAVFAFAQTAPKQFEVASIKQVEPGDRRVDLGYHIDGQMVSCTALSLRDYIRLAWQVKDYQIAGPEWLAENRFDLRAKLPEGAKGDDIREMIKSLLGERFHMKVHMDSKEFPVYALVQAKGGSKLTESAPDSTDEAGAKPVTNVQATGSAQGVNISLGRGSFFTFADDRIEGKRLQMANFADVLARFMDKPVVDMTGLPGRYDFTLKITEEDYRAMQIRAAISAGITLNPQALKLLEMASGDSLHSALDLVGLKLESRKAPLEVLVIEQADKTPTEN